LGVTDALSFRLLVALLGKRDLLLFAKYLFVAASCVAGPTVTGGYTGECPVRLGTKGRGDSCMATNLGAGASLPAARGRVSLRYYFPSRLGGATTV
jgi:hypothetical protein